MLYSVLTVADMGWNDHMGDWGAGWWIVMVVGMIAFWGLLILGVVWLVRSLGVAPHRHTEPNAHQILDRRLAQGEISPEEYRERRAALGDEQNRGAG